MSSEGFFEVCKRGKLNERISEMPKSERPGTLELMGVHDETDNFHRITIAGDKKAINGRIYISKELGIPERIVIVFKRGVKGKN